MSIFSLLWEEVLHRKMTSLLMVGVVVAAVASVCGAVFWLQHFDQRTEAIVAQTEGDTLQRVDEARRTAEQAAKALEDDYRKITKGLGFNMLILPAEQNMADWLRDDFARQDMPEEYVTKLASTNLVTTNHLLPTLTARITWPEASQEVIMIGVRGQVAIAGRDEKKPIMDPLPEGTVVVGYHLGQNLKLKKGDAVTFHDQPYKVHQVYPQRGTKDDISIWVPLYHAQTILNKPGRINAIFALQCHCDTADRMARIEQEISSVLGDKVKVVEVSGMALARARARTRAHEEAISQVARTEENAKAEVASVVEARQNLRGQRETMTAILVPIVLIGAVVWLGSLAWLNVRQRRSEIGILRAVGVGSGRILLLFLGKACLLGLVGASAGVLIGIGIAMFAGLQLTSVAAFIGVVLLATPLVAILAGWLPALGAIQMDPALALREE